MKPLFKLIPDHTRIPFMSFRFAAVIFSSLLVLGSLALVMTRGLTYGIDFAGGIVIEARYESAPDIAALRAELGALNLGDVAIQTFGEPDDILIRVAAQGSDAANQAAVSGIRKALGDQVTIRRTEQVGPQVGDELKEAALLSLCLALGGILLYVWFRFEWQFGVSAVLALAHDCITTVGLFALIRHEVNLATVAAVLTIAGYSINDTVVVFDRVREDLRRYKSRPLIEILNTALNETLSRTTMTAFTTLLALVALWAFGGEVIRDFVVALIWGITIGTYSSIFVAVPALIWMNIRRGQLGEAAGAPADGLKA